MKTVGVGLFAAAWAWLDGNWEFVAFGIGVIAIIAAIWNHSYTTKPDEEPKMSAWTVVKSWFHKTPDAELAVAQQDAAVQKARADQAQIHAMDLARQLQRSVPASFVPPNPAATPPVAKPSPATGSNSAPSGGTDQPHLEKAMATWPAIEAALPGPLKGAQETRIIVSYFSGAPDTGLKTELGESWGAYVLAYSMGHRFGPLAAALREKRNRPWSAQLVNGWENPLSEENVTAIHMLKDNAAFSTG